LLSDTLYSFLTGLKYLEITLCAYDVRIGNFPGDVDTWHETSNTGQHRLL